MAVSINSAWDYQVYYREREQARKSINSAWDAQKFYETYGGNGQLGNWGNNSRYAGSYGYVYDPVSHSWVKSSTMSFDTQSFDFSFDSTSLSSSGINFSSGSSSAISQSGVVNSNSSASTDSKTAAEQEYINIEFNTLTGECAVVPTKANMKLKVGDTVSLKGVGKYLSGLYFISEIKKTISNSGAFALSLTLYKNGFGDNLKSASSNSATVPANSARPTPVDTTKNATTKAIKVGSKVKVVGDNAVYSNAHEGVKIPNWVKQSTLEVVALSEDGLRARLNPINSWTYIKYLKLV